MLAVITPQDLQQYAIPIGIGLAILAILLIPPLRRSILDSFNQGRNAGERARKPDPEKKNLTDEPDA